MEARGEGPTSFGSRPDEQPRFGVRLPEGTDPGAYAGASGDNGGAPSSDGAESRPEGTEAVTRPSFGGGTTPDRTAPPSSAPGRGRGDEEV